MSLNNEIKQAISLEVIKVLVTRFASFPEDCNSNRNAPFHKAFLNAFSDKLSNSNTDAGLLISLSSWLHGLNTTLGQSFFENVANILCNGSKQEWTSQKLGNLPIYRSQKDVINTIMTELSNAVRVPDLRIENALLDNCTGDIFVNAKDFSADVFFDDNDRVVAIELKTVKPNSGGQEGEKAKILEGKAALKSLFPNKEVFFYLGFPFDPTVNASNGEDPCSFNKNRFLKSIVNGSKFFDPSEILLASELWDFLSGQINTMREIIDIINSIATPSFEEDLRRLQNYSLDTVETVLDLLQDWNLHSELYLVAHKEAIKHAINSDNKLLRLFNQSCLDNNGKFKQNRYMSLKDAIQTQ